MMGPLSLNFFRSSLQSKLTHTNTQRKLTTLQYFTVIHRRNYENISVRSSYLYTGRAYLPPKKNLLKIMCFINKRFYDHAQLSVVYVLNDFNTSLINYLKTLSQKQMNIFIKKRKYHS